MDTVEIYRDEDGDWRWRRRARNGRIIAVSGEGYHNLNDCKEMAVRINPPDVANVTIGGLHEGGWIR